MFLVKQKNGSFIPAYNSDWEASKKIKAGDEVTATKARNIKFHRKGFALLNLGFENQDKYENFDIYRQVITMKAGFVHYAINKDGSKYALPQSLSFEKMNAETFERWYNATLTVISKEAELHSTDIEAEIASFY